MLSTDAARLAELIDEHSAPNPLSQAQELCARCQQATGTTAVALSVAIDAAQHLSSTVCGTDALGRRLEEQQLGLAEGPIPEAMDSMLPVLAPDLASVAHPRWLWFGPAAVEAGARAVFVFPIRVGATCLGALSLYRSTSGDLTAEQFDNCAAWADVAAVILLSGHTHDSEEAGSWALGEGTGFQMEVHQAVGMTMANLNVDAEHALARLRGHAFVWDQPIGEVAHEIVARRLRLEDDAKDGTA